MSFCSYCCYILFFIALYTFIKLYNKLTTGVYNSDVKLNGKTIVVTGANSGIGYECAKDFAKRGAKVIMACRDMKTAEIAKNDIINETGNENIKLKHVDFIDLKSVRKCANEIISEESRIDVLLNNAGVGGGYLQMTDSGLSGLMQINHFGPFLFTNILLEKIKNSAPSRIVNVSSIAHNFDNLNTNNYKGKDVKETAQYSNSKLCNILFNNELARLLKGTKVTVNCLHPGVIASNITRDAPVLYQYFWKFVTNTFFKTVNLGAQTSIYLCVAPEVADVTGKYFKDCKEVTPSKKACDINFAKKIWELSETAVNLQQNEKHY